MGNKDIIKAINNLLKYNSKPVIYAYKSDMILYFHSCVIRVTDILCNQYIHVKNPSKFKLLDFGNYVHLPFLQTDEEEAKKAYDLINTQIGNLNKSPLPEDLKVNIPTWVKKNHKHILASKVVIPVDCDGINFDIQYLKLAAALGFDSIIKTNHQTWCSSEGNILLMFINQ